jgi:hypothetical protein
MAEECSICGDTGIRGKIWRRSSDPSEICLCPGAKQKRAVILLMESDSERKLREIQELIEARRSDQRERAVVQPPQQPTKYLVNGQRT